MLRPVLFALRARRCFAANASFHINSLMPSGFGKVSTAQLSRPRGVAAVSDGHGEPSERGRLVAGHLQPPDRAGVCF